MTRAANTHEGLTMTRAATGTRAGALPGLAVRCAGVVHIWSTGQEDVVALRGVDLEVPAGDRVALLGPSGSGKSTLLALLGGLLTPSAGQLWIGDTEITRLGQRALLALRSDRVGTMLQGAARNLLPYVSPHENVEFAQQSLRPSARHRVLAPGELLNALGLGRVADAPLRQLSGGEQQRVALAVAVANGPGLLLADEPTSQLDTAGRHRVVETLELVNDRFGTTVVVVTHDPAVGEQLGRTITMHAGRVGQEGRHGRQHAVLSADGAVTLPASAIVDWPPGSLFDVQRDGDTVHLTRAAGSDETNLDGPR